MGNPKQKWTAEEEEALRAGVAKYGAGKWKFIQKDPEFNKFLHNRSNIDLKDKWRNMAAAAGGQGSRDKLRTPKAKSSQDALVVPMATMQTPASAMGVAHDGPVDHVKDDPSKDLPDAKNGPRYNEMIFEALSASKEPSGLDIGSIVSYIEKKIEVPQNFRKLLGSRLRRLVQQEKLERIDHCYRIRSNRLVEANAVSQKSAGYLFSGESMELEAKEAAYSIAEAENKSFIAAEAVKEAERLSRMAEESDSTLQLAKEIFAKCTQGEILIC